MATRLYITARSPGTLLTGPPQGDWSAGDSDRDNRGQRRFLFLLAQTKTDGGVVPTVGVLSGASITKTTDQKIIAANINGDVSWVTDVLAANVTLSGTLTIILKVRTLTTAALGSAQYHVYAYVTVGDTLEQRAVLIDSVTDATLWTSTTTWRSAVFNLSGAEAQAGDRIAVEIGANCNPPTAPAGDNAYHIAWGTTNSSDVAQADATNGSTGNGAAWAEFSDALTFVAAPSPPANDACADATVIPEDLTGGYQAGPVDTTQSADTNRSIWYTWTAPADMRVFANMLRSNVYPWLRAWQGSCGSLSLVQLNTTGSTNSFRVPWVGTSQAAIWFDAVAGTQYWFQLACTRESAGTNALFGALNSGGAVFFNLYPYSAPETNDLFVDCQHIVSYRAGVPVDALSDFYGLTPTGNAVDYTLRPLDDLNGGTDESLRLYVCLFGASPLVEILDLATLNVGEAEVDFIQDPLLGTGHGENLSSVVFDRSGNIYLGWYGDNYAVVDRLATVPTADMRVMDATHADNQSGAPFALATDYPLAYENGGTDFCELASDQDTIWYTSGGVLIKRYSLTSGQLADFVTLPAATGPRPGARTLRLFPPGDGTAGLIVAYGDKILRYDENASLIQTYTPSNAALFQDLDKVEFNADASEFWASDQYSTAIVHFNVETGVEIDILETNLPPGQLCGFAVYNGYRAGQSAYVPPPVGCPDVVDVDVPVVPSRDCPGVVD